MCHILFSFYRMSSQIGTFKILIVGDSGIGKSSLMMRFVDGMFDPDISATIGKLLISLHFIIKISIEINMHIELKN